MVPRVPARLTRPLHWNDAASFLLGNDHRRSHTILTLALSGVFPLQLLMLRAHV
ncbi:hypothetical protein B0H11DRAFT_2289539 [Mycena galericulata]|nr:hypothetical protein B0H11DRAFT_2289539 [Mycena galericulata]